MIDTPPERIWVVFCEVENNPSFRSEKIAKDEGWEDLPSYTLTTTHEAALAAKDARIAELEKAMKAVLDDLDYNHETMITQFGVGSVEEVGALENLTRLTNALDPLKPLSDAGQAWDADGQCPTCGLPSPASNPYCFCKADGEAE